MKKESGNENIQLLLGDLSKVSEMKRIAAEFRAKYDRLDVLVNNAGAIFADRKLSADGFEMTFALNHLAYFVLTEELLDLLKKTPGSRVVSTSSGAHASSRLALDNLDDIRPSGEALLRLRGLRIFQARQHLVHPRARQSRRRERERELLPPGLRAVRLRRQQRRLHRRRDQGRSCALRAHPGQREQRR